MRKELEGKSAQELFYEQGGCGCCSEQDDPTWGDISKALREQIAQEIEALMPSPSIEVNTGYARAADIARGKK